MRIILTKQNKIVLYFFQSSHALVNKPCILIINFIINNFVE